MASMWALPAPDPYQGAARCQTCGGGKVTGVRYEFDPAGGSPKVLLADVICPGCDGCGRAIHDGCKPAEHGDWPHGDRHDYGDEDGEDEGEDVCPSCRGRRWWSCQGFAGDEVHYLRVACGCAADLLIEVRP